VTGSELAGLPGQVVAAEGTIELNPGRDRIELLVENGGDRPIQVGSHYHFAAANPALAFDRSTAWGRRLDIPAGTLVRFEPGLSKVVGLVPIGGRRVVRGLRREWAGPLDAGWPPGITGPAASAGPEDAAGPGGEPRG
jgi:urease subunit beta